MPASIHSNDGDTPRAPTFHVPTGESLQQPPIPDSLYSPNLTRTPTEPSPPLPDAIVVAPLFQQFPGCDLILRATKNQPYTDFYVDRRTVRARSSYLGREISALVDPLLDKNEVFLWEDHAHVLDAMLRFVYVDRPKPLIQDVSSLRALLEAARKYEIEAARHALGTAELLDFAQSDPIQAFAIACEFDLVGEASLISKETLEVDIMSFDENLVLNSIGLVRAVGRYYFRPLSNYMLHRAITTV